MGATPAPDEASAASTPPPKTNGEEASDKQAKSTPEGKGGTSNGKGAKEGKVTKKMLKEAEQELFQLLLKKKQADRNLIDAEGAIYDFETSYFEHSGQEGNIVRGFEGYLNTGRHERRQQLHFTDADRIFSQSSATFKKAQEAKIAASLLDSDSDDSDPGVRAKGRRPGGSTIRHRQGTPTGGRGTPTPTPRTTKKIRLSIDAS
ncbi:Chromatin modification- protein meaf6 [Coemansia sp. RSA 552]|nr:Chromatin modification- protein meaf6 [Coemansia sp. RSA 552]